MAKVEFEEESSAALNYFERPPRGLVKIVLRTGIVKTEKQVLLVFIGIIICSLLYMGFYAFHNPTSKVVSPQVIQKIDQSRFILR